MSREYGGLAVTTWCGGGHAELQVDRAPPILLLPLAALQTEHLWRIRGGRILVGVDLTRRPATREPVWYQTVGWDHHHQALIMKRESVTDTKANPYPDVQGHCPMGCGQTLFRAQGGHITCSYINCRQPTAVDDLLASPETEHVVTFEPDNKFRIVHPLRERLSGEPCLLESYIINLAAPATQPGRYRARSTAALRWSWELLPAQEEEQG